LNSVERNVHGDEEQSALNVLDSGFVLLGVPEKQGGESRGENCCDHLDIGSLWQTDNVHEVAVGEQLPLVTETSLNIGVSGVFNG